MEPSRAARRSARRAALFGALMAVIVFGGAIAYLIDTRPSAYRSEGGDFWALSRYRAAPGRAEDLERDLTARVRALDEAEGFWGIEILRSGGEVIALTRWRAESDYLRAQSAARDALSPAEGLASGPPTEETWRVIAR
jgi:hypothetical protein